MKRRHATQAGMLYGRHSDVFPHPDEGVTVVATADLAAMESRAAELESELASAWWDAWGAIWPVVGHCRETSRDWCEDVDRLERVERELDAVTAERDALLAGRWAGPWESLEGTADGAWARFSPTSVLVGLAFVPGKWSLGRDIAQQAPSLAEAKTAADAALAKQGWYLAPTPPTGTPGDGTR